MEMIYTDFYHFKHLFYIFCGDYWLDDLEDGEMIQ